MDLVREVLDEQLVDRQNRAMGKVDGIVLDIAPGRAPRVVAIEVGPATLLRRVHPALARWVLALTRRLGVGSGNPVRLSFRQLSREHVNLKADVDREATTADDWERWLRERVIGRIPGSGL